MNIDLVFRVHRHLALLLHGNLHRQEADRDIAVQLLLLRAVSVPLK
jgi:hypothetical protein